ncbi:MAG: hypothetical protein ACJ8FY_12555 [Gemmataceae bacterium]
MASIQGVQASILDHGSGNKAKVARKVSVSAISSNPGSKRIVYVMADIPPKGLP